MLFRYFLAEGTVYNHYLYVGSLDSDPKTFIATLPSVVLNSFDNETKMKNNDELTIAWRYKNMEIDNPKLFSFGHSFDLSKTIDESAINRLNITYWNNSERTKKLSKSINVFDNRSKTKCVIIFLWKL